MYLIYNILEDVIYNIYIYSCSLRKMQDNAGYNQLTSWHTSITQVLVSCLETPNQSSSSWSTKVLLMQRSK